MVCGLMVGGMKINSYKDLEVWQISMSLVVDVYKITKQLPYSEQYGLSSQMQRCGVSIPSNIAEGSKRSSRADFRQFCLIALGSTAELETQLLITQQLYPEVATQEAIGMNVRIQKMLTSLANKLKQTKRTSP